MDDFYTLRGFDCLKLKKTYARTTNFKFSFFNRIVDSWNSLLTNVRFSSDLSSFKQNLREFLV